MNHVGIAVCIFVQGFFEGVQLLHQQEIFAAVLIQKAEGASLVQELSGLKGDIEVRRGNGYLLIHGDELDL